MRASLHAVGRSADTLPFLALGAALHEVDSLEKARAAVRSLSAQPQSLILLSEEFAAAETEAPEGRVFVLPGVRGAKREALERTRELVSRSVGVDLIAKAKRMVRSDG